MRLITALFNKIGKWSKQYTNLPDEFIERQMAPKFSRPRGKQFKYPKPRPSKGDYGLHRPWTSAGQMYRRHGFVPIEPIKDWSFFRGDIVEILVGKDKGKLGKVKDVFQEKNWVIVSGRNLKLEERSLKGNKTQYMELEQPYLVTTDVQLVDPVDKKATEIEWRYTSEGERVRVSVRSGKLIPLPGEAYETKDYKKPELYKEREKDTSLADVEKITFKPMLKTFEMDIMEKMGIKEDRVPAKYYWY